MTETTELIHGRPQLRDTDALNRMAKALAASSLCPAQYKGKPQDAFVAIVAGAEVGFQPMQSLKSIAVINGRPTIYGDGLPAVAYASGRMKHFSEQFERDGKGEIVAAVVRIERKDVDGLREFRFSVDDAKRAGLWGKKGPWSDYPGRMLQMRARSYAFRDCFADYLGGLHVAEEVMDYTTSAPIQATQEADEHTIRFDEPAEETIDAEYSEPSEFQRLVAELATCKNEQHLAEFASQDVKPSHVAGDITDEEYDELHRLIDVRRGEVAE